jgi:hypothetical protein
VLEILKKANGEMFTIESETELNYEEVKYD